MASKFLARLSIALVASTNDFSKKMNSAKKQMTAMQKSSNLLSGAMKKLGFSIGSFLSARALGSFISDSLKSIDTLNDMAKKLDISTESLAGLRRAATLSGSSSEVLDKALDKMSDSISSANKNGGALRDTFKELGLNTADLINLDAGGQFKAIADAMQGIGNNADKIRLAKDIFGRTGGDLLETLKEGSAGLDKAIQDAIKSGQGVTSAQAEQVAKAMDAIDRLKLAWGGLGGAIAVGATGPIEDATTAMEEFVSSGVGGAGKVENAFNRLEVAMRSVAAVSPLWNLTSSVKERDANMTRIAQLQNAIDRSKLSLTQIPGRQGAQRIGSPNFPAAHLVGPGALATAGGMQSAIGAQALGPLGGAGTPPNWAEQLARSIAPAFVQHMQRLQTFDPRVRKPAFEPPFQFNYGAGGRMQPQQRGVFSSEERAATSKRSEDARQARIEASMARQEKHLAELVAIGRKGAPAVAQ